MRTFFLPAFFILSCTLPYFVAVPANADETSITTLRPGDQQAWIVNDYRYESYNFV